ncbi:MAG: hypothetical protein DME08_22685 [Candidatus Rokuibacteriota bacterium]|nr:MAG: hypothetical protein DME08_22685 [Candidatus Rokubacteria bacterium]
MKRLLLALAFLLLWPTTNERPSLAWADSCEDQLHTAKVALDQVVASRTRGEGDAAQVISRLLGQIQSLQAQVDLLLNSKDGK